MHNGWQRGNEAFAQSPNFGSSGVRMAVVCREETGLGHSAIKSAGESAFLDSLQIVLKLWIFLSIQHPSLR